MTNIGRLCALISLAISVACLPMAARQNQPTEADKPPVAGQDEDKSAEALQKATQNPVANLISVPVQNNSNFAVGPSDRVQDVLNIQPVIPVKLNDKWNLITRIIQPIVWQPYPSQNTGWRVWSWGHEPNVLPIAG
jgi:hypothetical protein